VPPAYTAEPFTLMNSPPYEMPRPAMERCQTLCPYGSTLMVTIFAEPTVPLRWPVT
jgi:hypothetical protein